MILAALFVAGAAFYTAHLRNPSTGRISEGLRFLEIKDDSSGRICKKWPVKEGDIFAIEFIHSVHQSPVRETFRIEGGVIKPEAVNFFSFGAGMQSDLDEGQTLSRNRDGYVIEGFSNSFPELNYIVGTVSDHLLFINGETVSLRILCGKNAHIKITIE